MWNILPFDIQFYIFKTLDIKSQKLLYKIDYYLEYNDKFAYKFNYIYVIIIKNNLNGKYLLVYPLKIIKMKKYIYL